MNVRGAAFTLSILQISRYEPVRRYRYEANQPKRVVYVSWKTVIASYQQSIRKNFDKRLTSSQDGLQSSCSVSSILLVHFESMMGMSYPEEVNMQGDIELKKAI